MDPELVGCTLSLLRLRLDVDVSDAGRAGVLVGLELGAWVSQSSSHSMDSHVATKRSMSDLSISSWKDSGVLPSGAWFGMERKWREMTAKRASMSSWVCPTSRKLK